MLSASEYGGKYLLYLSLSHCPKKHSCLAIFHSPEARIAASASLQVKFHLETGPIFFSRLLFPDGMAAGVPPPIGLRVYTRTCHVIEAARDLAVLNQLRLLARLSSGRRVDSSCRPQEAWARWAHMFRGKLTLRNSAFQRPTAMYKSALDQQIFAARTGYTFYPN